MYWKILSCFIAISAWISIVLTAMKRWSDEAMKRWSDEAMKWWSDEAMKQGDEVLNTSSLQFLSSVKHFIASSLQFFLSVKCFIAVTFYRKTSFNTSLPLPFKRNSSFNASMPLLFKVTLPTSVVEVQSTEAKTAIRKESYYEYNTQLKMSKNSCMYKGIYSKQCVRREHICV
jgi:hypothetical protein